MKTILPILLLFLPASVMAQQSFAPSRISITAESGDEYDKELKRLVGAELGRGARVAFVSRGADLDITLTAGPLSEDTKCAGVIGAMLVVDERGRRRLSIHTGSDLKALARHLAEKLEVEYLRRKGEK